MVRRVAPFRYPRRRLVRALLRAGIIFAFSILMDLKVTGQENIPEDGPYIVIGNHFHFLDPLALIRIIPAPMEFVGGVTAPNAPPWTNIFRTLWGILAMRRGGSSRDGLIAAQSTLEQGGILAVFPEGGSWAQVLRPPRLGTALIALRTRAPILPVGIHGLSEVFPMLARGKRARVDLVIGPLFQLAENTGLPQRQAMEEAGHEMMRAVSRLIPAERRGYYSNDPAVREAARGTEVYPWAGTTEN